MKTKYIYLPNSPLTKIKAKRKHFDLLPEDKKWTYHVEGCGLLSLWNAWYDKDKNFVGVSIVGERDKVGVVLMKQARGKGYLKHMYPINKTLWAEISKKNIASITAHKRLDFLFISETLYGEYLYKRYPRIENNI